MGDMLCADGDDEDLARRLDEQLNGPARLTRSRLRHVSSRHDSHDEDGGSEAAGYR